MGIVNRWRIFIGIAEHELNALPSTSLRVAGGEVCQWVLSMLICFAINIQTDAQPTVSFTFDDGLTADMPGYPFQTWNKMILDHLNKGGVKAIFFVTGSNKRDEKGQHLLFSWNAAGHRIGNHTMSHPNYSNKNVTFSQFKNEFQGNDSIIRTYTNYIPLFRFPYLKEGDTKEKVEAFRNLMRENHYTNGYVTIDASDWYIDSRLRKRLSEDPQADIAGFRAYYLKHLLEKAIYYETIAFELTGRHINHTLLLHHNLTSALFLADLIRMFRDKGWNVIDAESAYDDPIFKSQPTNIPAGESLIWALARQSGKFDKVLRYPPEDSQYEKEIMDGLGL
jgi:peptidoglycan/xylan/chitin deacetylase (PgdA/CDA1 family)